MQRRRFLSTLAGASLAWGAPACRRSRSGWSREAALDFLVGRQSGDGAWRSNAYGMFRGGEALTPLVLRAIHRDRPEAARAGIAWVAGQPIDTWTLFPVHNACWLLELAAQHDSLAKLTDPLKLRLLELQLGSRSAWPARHPYHGGWSYAGDAPAWNEAVEIPAMQQPNLSATVLAVIGLRAAGLAGDDPALAQARHFIRHCQNHGTEDPQFDDGGFHQMQGDLMRNKGGKAGQDSTGRTRFKSYAAATADGLTGLLLTGEATESPRVRVAVQWLEQHPGVSDVADLCCYAAHARTRAIRLLEQPELEPLTPPLPQHPDGSLFNPHGEMRENDPLVATSLAVMADEPGPPPGMKVYSLSRRIASSSSHRS